MSENTEQPEMETVEVKIQLDPIQSDAVAKTEDIVKRVQKEAERFQRYAAKKVQRFDREARTTNQKLGRALAASLGRDLPDGWKAWTRPDGTAELVFSEKRPKVAAPSLKEAAALAAKDTDATPPSGEAKITPIPVGAANGGSGH